MHIEYLNEGSEDCPLIRLYGDEPDAIALLKDKIVSLSNGSAHSILLNNLRGFHAINQCQLVLRTGSASIGVVNIMGNHFECVLSQQGWSNVCDLLAPLCQSREWGYQWIDVTGKISLLVSRYEDGQW